MSWQKGETLTNMLDYIKFEGEGFGLIEVKGTMTGSTPTVTEVVLHFNARGHKSPVTVGLYDIKPKDGQYNYENRSKPESCPGEIHLYSKRPTRLPASNRSGVYQ